MKQNLDPYSVLGVAPQAPDFVLYAAYRACLKRYHPDHYTAGDANLRTAEVVEAYRILKDPSRRAALDEALRQQADSKHAKKSRGISLRGAGRQGVTEPPRPWVRRRNWFLLVVLPALFASGAAALFAAEVVGSGVREEQGKKLERNWRYEVEIDKFEEITHSSATQLFSTESHHMIKVSFDCQAKNGPEGFQELSLAFEHVGDLRGDDTFFKQEIVNAKMKLDDDEPWFVSWDEGYLLTLYPQRDMLANGFADAKQMMVRLMLKEFALRYSPATITADLRNPAIRRVLDNCSSELRIPE